MNALVTKLLISKTIDFTPFLTADFIDDWINNITRWGLDKVLAIGGGILLIGGLADMVRGLLGKRKDFKQVGLGIVAVIFGGFLLIIGSAAWIKKAQMLGDAVPK